MLAGKIRIVQAQHHHVHALANRLREIDLREIAAFSGSGPLKALSRGLKCSDICLVAETRDGDPLVMFGVAPLSMATNSGVPWLLGTDQALDYPREFLVWGKRYAQAMAERYDSLMNYVHTENRVSIRWLKAIGFTVEDETVIVGKAREPFHRFHLER